MDVGMANGGTILRSSGGTPRAETEEDRYRRKFQRIVRSPTIESPHLSGGVGTAETRRMSEELKEATLSPKVVNPASVQEDEEPLFQCTDCDMIVKESDPYCPFCGAIFSDGPLGLDAGQSEVAEKPAIEQPTRREPMPRPERFDNFSLVATKSRSRELLYEEAVRGFSGSARLLEEVERLVSDIAALGTDTAQARRLIGTGWEACRDGNWNLVTTIAHQTEDLVEPSIPDLVRSEIAMAREHLAEAKASGVDISPHILRIKDAMQALRADDPDEALRITKELMDALREDSLVWSRQPSAK